MNTKKDEFNIYTAIDILDEQCVRLEQGDFDISTTYNQDPVSVAKDWKAKGAKWLHIVDLNGAKSGTRVNFDIIKEIMNTIDLKVQVGGGIRNIETAEAYLNAGISRIVVGSIAVTKPEIVKELLEKFGGDRVAVALDCRDGYVAIDGWQTKSDLKALNIINQYKEYGLKTVIHTDISKDGMLEGPNLEELRELAELTDINIIASGGVSNIDDIYNLKNLKKDCPNLDGVIIGKALYAQRIKPEELYTDEIYL